MPDTAVRIPGPSGSVTGPAVVDRGPGGKAVRNIDGAGPTPVLDVPVDPNLEVNRSMWEYLRRFLSDRGLGSLFGTDSNGVPSGWLWDQMVNGIDTEAEITIAIESTNAFRTRFGVILDMRERRLGGENIHVPTVDQVLEYEERVTGVLRSAGMPVHMYSDVKTLHNYLATGQSASEIEDRVDQVWNTVHGAAPEILAEFADIIGSGSDAMMAAFILDPENTSVMLERKVRQATVGGTADIFNIDVADDRRDQIANLPLTAAGITQGFGNIAGTEALFTEGFGEVDDLTAEETGINAEFFSDAGSQTAMEQRLIRRQAINRAASGGAQSQAVGISGLR